MLQDKNSFLSKIMFFTYCLHGMDAASFYVLNHHDFSCKTATSQDLLQVPKLNVFSVIPLCTERHLRSKIQVQDLSF